MFFPSGLNFPPPPSPITDFHGRDTSKALKKSKRGILEPFPTATSLHKIFTTLWFSVVSALGMVSNAVIHCWLLSKHAEGMSLRYDEIANLIRPSSKKSFYYQEFFTVKRRAVFILGPNAKHSTLLQSCFLFLIPFTIRQQCIIYTQEFSTEPKHALENSLISMPYFEDWQIVGVCNRLHLENKFFQRQERNMWNFYS